MDRKGKKVSDNARVCNGRMMVDISNDFDLKRMLVSTIVNIFKKTGWIRRLPRGESAEVGEADYDEQNTIKN